MSLMFAKNIIYAKLVYSKTFYSQILIDKNLNS